MAVRMMVFAAVLGVVLIGCGESKEKGPRRITAEELAIVDAQGRERIVLGVEPDGRASVRLFNGSGSALVALLVEEQGSQCSIELGGREPTLAMRSEWSSHGRYASIGLYSDSTPILFLSKDTSDCGQVLISDSGGNELVSIESREFASASMIRMYSRVSAVLPPPEGDASNATDARPKPGEVDGYMVLRAPNASPNISPRGFAVVAATQGKAATLQVGDGAMPGWTFEGPSGTTRIPEAK